MALRLHSLLVVVAACLLQNSLCNADDAAKEMKEKLVDVMQKTAKEAMTMMKEIADNADDMKNFDLDSMQKMVDAAEDMADNLNSYAEDLAKHVENYEQESKDKKQDEKIDKMLKFMDQLMNMMESK